MKKRIRDLLLILSRSCIPNIFIVLVIFVVLVDVIFIFIDVIFIVVDVILIVIDVILIGVDVTSANFVILLIIDVDCSILLINSRAFELLRTHLGVVSPPFYIV